MTLHTTLPVDSQPPTGHAASANGECQRRFEKDCTDLDSVIFYVHF